MHLHLSTWQEIEKYLVSSSGIIVPIGSTEQHGPNGLIGTDAITAEKIAHLIADAKGALVAPTLNIGMAEHHMAFPGTISLRPTTLISLIYDVVTSLARHGFRRIFFINGHGGNIASLNAAFSETYATYSNSHKDCDFRCSFANWYSGKRVGELTESLFGKASGHHATPAEVSLSYYIQPESVKSVVMTPKIAANGSIGEAQDFRRQFPDGRIGSDPSLASVEKGKAICDAAFEDISEAYLAFLET